VFNEHTDKDGTPAGFEGIASPYYCGVIVPIGTVTVTP